MYYVKTDAAPHTCWESDEWDGTLSAPGACAGCDEAVQHPCEFCGYGHVFTTHNPEPHYDEDPQTPAEPVPDPWIESPHIYA